MGRTTRHGAPVVWVGSRIPRREASRPSFRIRGNGDNPYFGGTRPILGVFALGIREAHVNQYEDNLMSNDDAGKLPEFDHGPLLQYIAANYERLGLTTADDPNGMLISKGMDRITLCMDGSEFVFAGEYEIRLVPTVGRVEDSDGSGWEGSLLNSFHCRKGVEFWPEGPEGYMMIHQMEDGEIAGGQHISTPMNQEKPHTLRFPDGREISGGVEEMWTIAQCLKMAEEIPKPE